jgi:hypothetical protein
VIRQFKRLLSNETAVNLHYFCTVKPVMARPSLGPTKPPTQWVQGALPGRVKRPGREADHSPPYSPEVKNAWRYTSTPITYGVVLS